MPNRTALFDPNASEATKARELLVEQQSWLIAAGPLSPAGWNELLTSIPHALMARLLETVTAARVAGFVEGLTTEAREAGTPNGSVWLDHHLPQASVGLG